MKVAKIGKKTWNIVVIRQICQSFFTVKGFYYMWLSEQKPD